MLWLLVATVFYCSSIRPSHDQCVGEIIYETEYKCCDYNETDLLPPYEPYIICVSIPKTGNCMKGNRTHYLTQSSYSFRDLLITSTTTPKPKPTLILKPLATRQKYKGALTVYYSFIKILLE